ncbi:MAG TPA: hypothetical protein PLO50_02650, partial [Nitrospira sp.]|nr:hypothetical protein [Nitrospira sp.]
SPYCTTRCKQVSADRKQSPFMGVTRMTKRRQLREELIRQRTLLLTDWNFSLVPPLERAC